MAFSSSPDLLTLHAVRLNGFAADAAIARRFELDVEDTRVRLEKYAADGLVGFSSFADVSGWSLTEAGRQTNEAQLRDELDLAGAREQVSVIHDQFLPRNAIVSAACSAVQLDPGPGTYESCWQDLSSVAEQLRGLEQRLSGHLSRFAGYHGRFATALFKADDDPTWFTGTEVDSCHRVWFEFHEDLIATLGLSR
jgi:hypothetical protein